MSGNESEVVKMWVLAHIHPHLHPKAHFLHTFGTISGPTLWGVGKLFTEKGSEAALTQLEPMVFGRVSVCNFQSIVCIRELDTRKWIFHANFLLRKCGFKGVREEPFKSSFVWNAANRGVTNEGLRGLAALPGNRPAPSFFPLFLPFSPFSRGPGEQLGNPEKRKKTAFSLKYPWICLSPHLLSPICGTPICALKVNFGWSCFWNVRVQKRGLYDFGPRFLTRKQK